MKNYETNNILDSVWREKVYIETSEYIIKGFIYMPKIGKRSRLLSDVLNSNKTFIAVKDCSFESKLSPAREVENHDFVQVNISTILIMRPIDE